MWRKGQRSHSSLTFIPLSSTSQPVALLYFSTVSFSMLEPSTMGKDCLEGLSSEKPAQTVSFLLLLGNKVKSASVNHLVSKE